MSGCKYRPRCCCAFLSTQTAGSSYTGPLIHLTIKENLFASLPSGTRRGALRETVRRKATFSLAAAWVSAGRVHRGVGGMQHRAAYRDLSSSNYRRYSLEPGNTIRDVPTQRQMGFTFIARGSVDQFTLAGRGCQWAAAIIVHYRPGPITTTPP